MQRRNSFVLFAFVLCMALPLWAQEKKDLPKDEMMSMTPPKPIMDDFCQWLVGEWEGTTTSSMGKSQDWQKVEWGLDNQFLMTTYTAKTVETSDEGMKMMSETMKMSKEDIEKMKDMVYKGMGPITIDPRTGEYVGYWFDNWRGTYKGTGKLEGNKLTMTWEGPMGTEVRTMEKVSNDKLVVTAQSTDPSGNRMESRSEMMRKKMAEKK